MRKKYSRRHRKQGELLLVPMIDIFTVLVTFLLMTAVFSRISIVELDLPSSRGEKVTEPAFRLEVILRKEGFEVTNGKDRIAAVPKVSGAYDLATLSQLAISLKHDHPDVDNASVLLEPDIEYDSLIQVMDAIRSTEVPVGPSAQPTKVALFEDIAVGDAP
jgi:biopolymer transport protein ExbD